MNSCPSTRRWWRFRKLPRSLEQVYLKVMTDAQASHAEMIHA